jgi:hypothetical protein
MVIICEQCGREHALFWLVRKKGRRDVVYTCDRVEKLYGTGIDQELKMVTENILWPGTDSADPGMLASLPEKLTPARKKEISLKNQLQLILTHGLDSNKRKGS